MSEAASTSADAGRYSLAKVILGQEAFSRSNSAHILVVGAGGIGCELLKNLVMVGIGHITIIDLDTIDLSNLNRQFLFQKQHIKKPKSLVARDTALAFNPLVDIVAHHANIKEAHFDVSYYKRFDVILNALDNLDARRHVNKMCIAADVPLVESGTTGFLGQVQPIRKGITECYDCVPKPVPLTYPVCTIRSTPSAPIHCIVWAKSWLFTQLFGADDETKDEELDKALKDGEDAQEIGELRKEAKQMKEIRAAVVDSANDAEKLEELARRVFDKVYGADIDRLLGMEEMWKHRPTKPVPLRYDSAREQGETNGDATATPEQHKAAQEKKTSLKDQRTLSLAENVAMFAASVASLAKRAAADDQPLSFDKDDEDALDFVTAASNLRSHVYSIEQKTRFQVKQMAGNIIPAIATTNAIVAGQQVVQALHILRGRFAQTRTVHLSRGDQRFIASSVNEKPNEECVVCQESYVPLKCDADKLTLGALLQRFVRAEEGLNISEDVEVVIFEGTRLLADPDFDDNLEKTLADLGVTPGKMLAIADEDGVWKTVNIAIEQAEQELVLPSKEDIPPMRKKPIKKEVPQTESDSDDDIVQVEASAPLAIAGKKRSADEAAEPPAKKTRKQIDPNEPIELD